MLYYFDRDSLMFILLITKRDKQISSTVSAHFIVFTILSVQLSYVQFSFQSDDHCSENHPSMSLSVGNGELSVVCC